MININFFRIILLFFPIYVYGIQSCNTLYWQKSKIYTIKSSLHKATHIIFPECIISKPIVGNKELWNIEGSANHLFIKPNSTSIEGSETTVTVIDKYNNSYEFLIKKVESNPDTCINIVNKNIVSNPNINKESSIKLESELKEKVRQRINEALRNYQNMIYTRYKIKKTKGFYANKLISDIWDDSRFTFIRLNNDNRGIMTITAELNNKKEIIEYKYDSNYKIYKISGIFPKLILQYGYSSVIVERENYRNLINY